MGLKPSKKPYFKGFFKCHSNSIVPRWLVLFDVEELLEINEEYCEDLPYGNVLSDLMAEENYLVSTLTVITLLFQN